MVPVPPPHSTRPARATCPAYLSSSSVPWQNCCCSVLSSPILIVQSVWTLNQQQSRNSIQGCACVHKSGTGGVLYCSTGQGQTRSYCRPKQRVQAYAVVLRHEYLCVVLKAWSQTVPVQIRAFIFQRNAREKSDLPRHFSVRSPREEKEHRGPWKLSSQWLSHQLQFKVTVFFCMEQYDRLKVARALSNHSSSFLFSY